MKHLLVITLSVLCALFAPAAFAADEHGDEQQQLQGIVKNILGDNAAFVKAHNAAYYKSFAEAQHPRATVLSCSDSQIHAHAIDKTPDGDLFVVRNMGNQISTAEGSVEYGVYHLHTPLLIIVGHSACEAIKAAAGDYSKEPPAIKRELESIKLTKKQLKNDDAELISAVGDNVNKQVAFALKKFDAEVQAGKLTVVGAIYDIQNIMHQGQGRLVIVNINGNTDSGNILSGLIKFSGVNGKSGSKATISKADSKPEASKAKHEAAKPEKAVESTKPEKAVEPKAAAEKPAVEKVAEAKKEAEHKTGH